MMAKSELGRVIPTASEEAGRYLDLRRAYSEEKLAEVRAAVAKEVEITDQPHLCIYAAGSFGRLEAYTSSDLDVFCVARGSARDPRISKLEKTLVDACLIRIARALEFKEFSDDGRYLETHFLDDILASLGSPIDDFENHFTARLLLLLESRPVYNVPLYDEAKSAIVGSYFRDFQEHPTNFKPVFFVNDVVRYWKTVCLNYEHTRNPGIEPTALGKHRIKNVKLKFSRMLTCFSAIIAVAHERGVQKDGIIRILQSPPLERLRNVCGSELAPLEQYHKLVELYAWFLELTGRTRQELIEWLEDPIHRQEVLRKAGEFGNAMYSLLRQTTDDEIQRFIVI